MHARSVALAPPIHSLTPYINQRFGRACSGDHDSRRVHVPDETRACTPCYSLLRRYRPGERRSHETHHDAQALVSVVVSISHLATLVPRGIPSSPYRP
mgnify:CR=1 FL=1